MSNLYGDTVIPRRGTTEEIQVYQGQVGEIVVDTSKDTVVVMDGQTSGGYTLAKASDVYTKTQVDFKLKDIINGGSVNIDLSNYYTKSEIDNKLQNNGSVINIDISSLFEDSKFQKKLTEFINEKYHNMSHLDTSLLSKLAEHKGELYFNGEKLNNKSDLMDYLQTGEFFKLINNSRTRFQHKHHVEDIIGLDLDLTKYYTKTQVDRIVQNLKDSVGTSNVLAQLAELKDKIQSFENTHYTKSQTETYVTNAISRLAIPDMTLYVTKNELDSSITARLINHPTRVEMNSTILDQLSSSLQFYYNKAKIDETIELIRQDMKKISWNDLKDRPLILDTTNFYEKYEVDSLLESKANERHEHDKSEIKGLPDFGTFATKAELTNYAPANHTHVISYNDLTNLPVIPSIDHLATKTEVNTKADRLHYHSFNDLQDKPDIMNRADYYTKAEVDAKDNNIRELAYTKIEVDGLFNIRDSKITDKADKTSVYTKVEVDTKIANIATGGTVDLSNYYTKAQIDTLLNGINSAISTINTNITGNTSLIQELRVSVNDINTTLASKANTSTLSDYRKKTVKILLADLDPEVINLFNNDKVYEAISDLSIKVSNKAEISYVDENFFNRTDVILEQHLDDALADKINVAYDSAINGGGGGGGSYDDTVVVQRITDLENNKASVSELTKYREKTVEIIEADLAPELASKINSGASGVYDDTIITNRITEAEGKIIALEGEVANKADQSSLSNYRQKSVEIGEADLTQAVKDKLNQSYDDTVLATEIQSLKNNKADKGQLTGLATKAELDNYRDKAVDIAEADLTPELANKINTAVSGVYDDTLISNRITAVEGKTSTLESSMTDKVDKTQLDALATKSELDSLATKTELSGYREKSVEISEADLAQPVKDKLNSLSDTSALEVKVNGLELNKADKTQLYAYRELANPIAEADLSPEVKSKLNTPGYDDTAVNNRISDVESTKADKTELNDYRQKAVEISETDLDAALKAKINTTYDDTELENAIAGLSTDKVDKTDLANYRKTAVAIEEVDLSEALATKINTSSSYKYDDTFVKNKITYIEGELDLRILKSEMVNYYDKATPIEMISLSEEVQNKINTAFGYDHEPLLDSITYLTANKMDKADMVNYRDKATLITRADLDDAVKAKLDYTYDDTVALAGIESLEDNKADKLYVQSIEKLVQDQAALITALTARVKVLEGFHDITDPEPPVDPPPGTGYTAVTKGGSATGGKTTFNINTDMTSDNKTEILTMVNKFNDLIQGMTGDEPSIAHNFEVYLVTFGAGGYKGEPMRIPSIYEAMQGTVSTANLSWNSGGSDLLYWDVQGADSIKIGVVDSGVTDIYTTANRYDYTLKFVELETDKIVPF